MKRNCGIGLGICVRKENGEKEKEYEITINLKKMFSSHNSSVLRIALVLFSTSELLLS